MTPYRFSLIRILFGLYLSCYFFYLSGISTIHESRFMYWGLIAISLLLTLGYQRQLVSRSLFFFSYLLFAFEKTLQNFNSLLVLIALIYFALVSGLEPWKIQAEQEKSNSGMIDFRARKARLYMLFEFILFGGVFAAAYLFQIAALPNYNTWTTWVLLAFYIVMFFPAFLFRSKQQSQSPILFFDGFCGLCNHTVDFVLTEDKNSVFKVAPLQGETAKEKLPKELRENLNSVVVMDSDGTIYQKSEAILNVLYDLGGFWRLFYILRLLPRPLCDVFYNIIAKFRYKIFGKRDVCRLPTETEKLRFLD